MRIVWVTRSFLDYRIPVFNDLDELVDGNLFLLFSGDYVPETVTVKAKNTLGDRAFPLSGEMMIGKEDQFSMANKNFSFRWQPGLISKIIALNPDVIVCDGFFKWTLPGLICRLRYGIPLVINYERTRHTERNAQWVRTMFRKSVLRFTDAVDCAGKLCQEYVEDLGMPSNRITCGHMSADTKGLSSQVDSISSSRIRELQNELDLKGVIFIYVGRLDNRKGCIELLTEWCGCDFHSDIASILIVGDGPLRKELEAMADGKSNVRFTGAIPYDEVADYYAVADAFVIATLEDNWSLVIPEAMSVGLPIVSSIFNGCWPELVRKGENGWTFDPSKKGELALVFNTVSSMSKHDLRKMGSASREIIAGYGSDHAAASILDACKLALSNRASGCPR